MAPTKRTSKQIILSSLLALLAASIAAALFCLLALQNTVSAGKIETTTGTVQAVEDSSKPHGISIAVADNDSAFLIPAGFSDCKTLTGYDAKTLAELLAGHTVEIRYLANTEVNHVIGLSTAETEADFLACVRDYHTGVHVAILLLLVITFGLIAAVWRGYLKGGFKKRPMFEG